MTREYGEVHVGTNVVPLEGHPCPELANPTYHVPHILLAQIV